MKKCKINRLGNALLGGGLLPLFQECFMSSYYSADKYMQIREASPDDFLTGWLDPGFLGYDFSQASAPIQPLYGNQTLNGYSVPSFTGTEYLEGDVNMLDGAASGTVVMLLRRNGWSIANAGIYSKQRNDSVGGHHLVLRRNGTLNGLQLLASNDVSLITLNSVGTLSDLTWYKIAFTWGSGTYKLYIDDPTTADASISGSYTVPSSSVVNYLGTHFVTSRVFLGEIPEFYVSRNEYGSKILQMVFDNIDWIYGL